jgi:hypothetical protein
VSPHVTAGNPIEKFVVRAMLVPCKPLGVRLIFAYEVWHCYSLVGRVDRIEMRHQLMPEA